MVPGTYLKSVFNIRSVTAEIFLIWTSVPRKNVALTNVNLIVGICSRYCQESTFEISSKLGQLSMSGISQLLLTLFWWKFKGSFLGTSRSDSNYQVDICQGNIWIPMPWPGSPSLSISQLQIGIFLIVSKWGWDWHSIRERTHIGSRLK